MEEKAHSEEEVLHVVHSVHEDPSGRVGNLVKEAPMVQEEAQVKEARMVRGTQAPLREEVHEIHIGKVLVDRAEDLVDRMEQDVLALEAERAVIRYRTKIKSEASGYFLCVNHIAANPIPIPLHAAHGIAFIRGHVYPR